MENVFHSFSRFFKRAHPYTVAHYIGRKNAQRILGCKIKRNPRYSQNSTLKTKHINLIGACKKAPFFCAVIEIVKNSALR